MFKGLTLFCRGQNPMHVLGQYCKDNAAAIFELFMECMPEYPINKPDQNGNTSEYHKICKLWGLFVTVGQEYMSVM